MSNKIQYSNDELKWIEKHSKEVRKVSHAKFVNIFNRNDVSLSNYNALCKRNKWMTGRTGCYPKGNIPDNKGKKMPYNPNSAATQFKPGRLPHNTKFPGHERLTKDGYIEVSIEKENKHTGFGRSYRLKHLYLWEQQNGTLDDGMCLKCLDGDRSNCSPDNWHPIPRGALPFLNGYRGASYDSAPDELKPSILLLAKLKHKKSKIGNRGGF